VIPPVDTRWPLEDLVAAVGADRVAEAFKKLNGNGPRSRRRGLTDVQADRMATACGLHPALVWGWAWYEVALAPEQAA
jgi:hypothetical protein